MLSSFTNLFPSIRGCLFVLFRICNSLVLCVLVCWNKLEKSAAYSSNHFTWTWKRNRLYKPKYFCVWNDCTRMTNSSQCEKCSMCLPLSEMTSRSLMLCRPLSEMTGWSLMLNSVLQITRFSALIQNTSCFSVCSKSSDYLQSPT